MTSITPKEAVLAFVKSYELQKYKIITEGGFFIGVAQYAAAYIKDMEDEED